MFNVDYATLRQILQQFAYTGVFRARIVGFHSRNDGGNIELHVNEGIIEACFFVPFQGHAFRWDGWETQLEHFGTLNWEITTPPVSGLLSRDFGSQKPAGQGAKFPPSNRLTARLPPSGASTPETSFEASGGISPLAIPVQSLSLSPEQLLHLPPQHRRVYALLDGRRSIADVALILHKAEQEITRIVVDLWNNRLIQLY